MATDIASKEPTQIRAGDTIKWKRSMDGSPSSVLEQAWREA